MRPPTVATWILKQFRPRDEALIGDLLEEVHAGRSTGWYWRQVVIAILAGSAREVGAHPLLGLRALAIGWAVMLLFFGVFGDLTAEALAEYGWNWSRYRDGYGEGYWWPFWVAASCVSYVGFAISAWTVARFHSMAMVMTYLSSVLVALSIAAAIVEWVPRPLPLPHALYYVVSVGLPFVWHSGFVFVPLVILLAGLLSCRPTVDHFHKATDFASRL